MTSISQKTIYLRYFALFREQAQKSDETLLTSSKTPLEIFNELNERYHFQISVNALRVAVNDRFVSWQTILKDKDSIVFIPPVAGG